MLGSVALTSLVRSGSSGPAAHNLVATAPWEQPAAAAEPAASTRRRPAAHPLAQPCQETAERLRRKLGEECAVIVREPFILAGDLSAERLAGWHAQTIDPAARAMAARYCRRAPDQPITVLLFAGETSYNTYAKDLFGDEQISVYGYYKPALRTLVMNIGTGGGTLVHELTHALVDFDFPRIPDWFNEGLASLHEHCRFRHDRQGPWIEGLENWRLPGLQQAIRQRRLRSLSALIQDDDFRGPQQGNNYAQARYFCLYLQRQELLAEFYARFRANHRQDPLGHATLSALFPDQTWDQLDREFNDWVLTLEH